MPLIPLDLQIGAGRPVRAQGLLDSGATVNVMPFDLGVRLGAAWENQRTSVTLTGNLAALEARALLVEARIAQFPAVRLAFAWTRADAVPLLLGQINFFKEFDICFCGARQEFEVQLATSSGHMSARA
jgi:hypothetical protein